MRALDQTEPTASSAKPAGVGERCEDQISQLPLAAMLWQLHQKQQSLVLHAGGGSIFLDQGEVVHANAGELEGTEALAHMLAQRSATVHTTPLIETPRTLSEPLRSLLDSAMSLVTGERPLPVQVPRARRETPAPIERLRSISYSSFGSFAHADTSPTQSGVTPAERPDAITPSAVSPQDAAAALAVPVLSPQAHEPTSAVAPVLLSVVVTLGVTLGLMYSFWPREDPSLAVFDQLEPADTPQPGAPAAPGPSAWAERSVVVKTRPAGLPLVDALSGRPVGVSPLEVELGGDHRTWKLAARFGDHFSPVLFLPEQGQQATFDLTNWVAALDQRARTTATARRRARRAARRRRRLNAARLQQASAPAGWGAAGDKSDVASDAGGRQRQGPADKPNLGLVDDDDRPTLGTVD